ncbi:MAG: hypothetical protein FDW93_02785 [Bergeyella sp.]|nr:hypothetical protein [Bergeyella sp.]
MSKDQIKLFPVLSIIIAIAAKVPFFLTRHIQEDAFITWRVAHNLLNYGVIGFNGTERISASTSYLYVGVSSLFMFFLGKENFIEALLVGNTILFTLGTYFLSKILFRSYLYQGLFVILIGILPPAIRTSILGMEYGLLFFLEMSLLYFGFFHGKKWVKILLPLFIIFTRLDAVIFLAVLGFTDMIWRRRPDWILLLGGAIALGSYFAFNFFYFGEWVNNTIIAKYTAYQRDFTVWQLLDMFAKNSGNFWGMLKLPVPINPFTVLVLLFELFCFIYLVNIKNSRNFFIGVLFLFGWIKQALFLSQRSYFDWYYWIPQLVLFVPVLVFILEQQKRKYFWLSLLFIFYLLPMIGFQLVHSISTGNGEWNYRRKIGLFLDRYEKNKNEWIFLEPAGYIPYFSGLKTIDEVGLVDKGVQKEMREDREHYFINIVKNRKPKYILSYRDLYQDRDRVFYKQNYRLVRKFRIENHLHSDSAILEKIYRLKPSGTDYNLYQIKKNKKF